MTQIWPLQSECDRFYGNPRGGYHKVNAIWSRNNIVKVTCPWQLYDDDNLKVKITNFSMHRKVKDSLDRIFAKAWEEIWHKDQDLVEKDNMHRFSGSFVFRSIRGSTHLSMHAYGIALDFAANLTGLGEKYDPKKGPPMSFVKIFEDEGAVWGGRWKTRPDCMHFQFARVTGPPFYT